MNRQDLKEDFIAFCQSLGLDKKAVEIGIAWADEHPNGFINYSPSDKSFTNKEFQELLQQYPDNATICVECCNPRATIYDEENNLIRID